MAPEVKKETPKYYSMIDAADKLLDTWEKWGTLILAVDFDDTIRSNDASKDFTELHGLLRQAEKYGMKIVIYTARPRKAWHEIIELCNDIELEIDGINVNLIKGSDGLGESGKIYYDLLLDDKAGLSQAALILKKILLRVKDIMK